MTKIQDIRNRTKRTNGTRKLSQIKYIVRHHSATDTGDFDTFWRHWNGTRGWGTGGYHEIILRDGTVQLCYDPHEITNGVSNYNTPCYHICLVGNGSFTEAQEKAWGERVEYNMDRLNVGVNNVKGHKEMPNSNTACPGINMDTVRSRIKGSKVVEAPKTQVKSETISKSKAKLKVDGYWGPATTKALQRYFGTTVDGVISGQPVNKSTKNIPSVKYGTGGSNVVKAMQKWLGTPQDRYISAPSLMVKALQKRFGTHQDGIISKPSLVVKELQRRLNKGNL